MKYNHFENIGFAADISEMFEQTISKSKKYLGKKYQDFDYHIYNDNKIYLVFNIKKNEIMSLNPHFQGKSINKLSLNRFDINHAGDCAVEGWIEPTEDLNEGMSPIYFNFYDYFVSLEFKVPRLQNMQITAFAHEFDIYKDTSSFLSAKTLKLDKNLENEPKEISFAPNYFIAVGLSEEQFTPIAQFAATVKEVNIVKNNLTNKQFYHILAQGMIELDIVYPYEKDLKIDIGNIIDGTYWLSATIVQ